MNLKTKFAYLYCLALTFFVWIMYNKFILLSNFVLYILILTSLIISFGYFFKKREKAELVLKVFYMTLVTLVSCYFLLCFFTCEQNKPECFKVDLVGYHTSKIDGILFKFENKNCDRPYEGITDIVNKEGKDFYKNYYVGIVLKRGIGDSYLIKQIQLIKK